MLLEEGVAGQTQQKYDAQAHGSGFATMREHHVVLERIGLLVTQL